MEQIAERLIAKLNNNERGVGFGLRPSFFMPACAYFGYNAQKNVVVSAILRIVLYSKNSIIKTRLRYGKPKGDNTMTMNERKMESIEKEIAKIANSLERYEAILTKKTAICIKLNCDWTDEEYRNRMQQIHARHEGEQVVWFGEDDDLITKKQNSAWFDKSIAEDNVEDCKRRLANAEKRYAKISETVRAENEKNEEFRKAYEQASEMERQMLRQKAKEEYEKWLAWFKAECLKDGVVINEASNNCCIGITPSGKKFSFWINNGHTERSWHCYSLRIDGKVIFTSGEFWRCYDTVKRR